MCFVILVKMSYGPCRGYAASYHDMLRVQILTGNGQKCHDSATLIPAPAERPVLTGKSTPESVMVNPSEEEAQLGDGNETAQPDKDTESQQAVLYVATEGEPIIRELSSEAKPLTESELDSKSCNPNESLTQHVLPEHSSEQTTEEEQQTSAKGAVVKEEEEEEAASTLQTIPLPGVVTFRLSDLPEPRERSESMRTEMSSLLDSAANFRAGELKLMNSVMLFMNNVNHLVYPLPQTCLFALHWTEWYSCMYVCVCVSPNKANLAGMCLD